MSVLFKVNSLPDKVSVCVVFADKVLVFLTALIVSYPNILTAAEVGNPETVTAVVPIPDATVGGENSSPSASADTIQFSLSTNIFEEPVLNVATPLPSVVSL